MISSSFSIYSGLSDSIRDTFMNVDILMVVESPIWTLLLLALWSQFILRFFVLKLYYLLSCFKGLDLKFQK